MFWDQLATNFLLVKITFMVCWPLTNLSVCTNKCSQTDYLPERHMTRFLPLWHVFFWNFPSGHDLSLQWVSILEVLHVLPKSSNHKQNQQFVYRQLKPGPTQTSQKKWHVSIVYLVLSLGPVACCCPKSSTHRHLQYVCKKLSHVPTHTMYRKVTYVWDQLTTIPHWPISLLCCVDMLTICMCAPTSAAKPYYLPERHMGGFCHCEKFSVLKLSISYNVFHFAVWHFCLGVHITLGRTTVCKPLGQCVPTQCFDIHTDRQTYIQTVHTIPAQPTSTQPT